MAANTRTPTDIRTTFSVDGVDTYVGAARRASAATESAFKTINASAAATTNELSAVIEKSNKAVFAAEVASSRVASLAAKGGGSRVAALSAQRRAVEAAAAAKAINQTLYDVADEQRKRVTYQAFARQRSLISDLKAKLRRDLESGATTMADAKTDLRWAIRGSSELRDAEIGKAVAPIDSMVRMAELNNQYTKSNVAAAAAEEQVARAMREAEKAAKQKEAALKAETKAQEQAARAAAAAAAKEIAAATALESQRSKYLAKNAKEAEAIRAKKIEDANVAVSRVFHGFEESFGGIARIDSNVIKLFGTIFRDIKKVISIARTAIKVVRALTKTVLFLAKPFTMVAKAAEHAGLRIARAIGGAPVHAAHALAHALGKVGHALARIGRFAIHEAIHLAKWVAGYQAVVGAASTALAKKSVSDTTTRALGLRGDAFDSGMTPDQLQAAQGVAALTGTDAKAVVKSMDSFRQIWEKAIQNPAGPEAQAFAQNGISTKDIFGNALSESQAFQNAARASAGGNVLTKQAIAQQFFGGMDALKNQAFFDRIGADGSEGAKNSFSEGLDYKRRKGSYLSTEDIQQAHEYDAAIKDTQEAFTGIKTTIGREITPLFQRLAEIASSFLTQYKRQIADFVEVRLVNIVHNLAMLTRIVEQETHIFEKLKGQRAQATAPDRLFVTRAYEAFNRYIRGRLVKIFHQIATASIRAYGAIGRFLQAHDVHSLDEVINKIKQGIAVLKSFGSHLKLAFEGKDFELGNSPILAKLAVFRNRLVAYVTAVVAEVRATWNGDYNPGETFFGRLANHILYLDKQIPVVLDRVKKAVQDGVGFVRKLWTEFLKVLGGGPEDRGESKIFPWLNKLIGFYDDVSKVVMQAIDVFKELHSIMISLLGTFSSDPQKLLFWYFMLRASGILGPIVKIFFGMGSAVNGLIDVLSGAGMLASIKNLFGLATATEALAVAQGTATAGGVAGVIGSVSGAAAGAGGGILGGLARGGAGILGGLVGGPELAAGAATLGIVGAGLGAGYGAAYLYDRATSSDRDNQSGSRQAEFLDSNREASNARFDHILQGMAQWAERESGPNAYAINPGDTAQKFGLSDAAKQLQALASYSHVNIVIDDEIVQRLARGDRYEDIIGNQTTRITPSSNGDYGS